LMCPYRQVTHTVQPWPKVFDADARCRVIHSGARLRRVFTKPSVRCGGRSSNQTSQIGIGLSRNNSLGWPANSIGRSRVTPKPDV